MLKTARFDETDITALRGKTGAAIAQVMPAVQEIIEQVRRRGDAALQEYSRKFDGVDLDDKGLRVSGEEIRAAYEQVSPEFLEALRKASANIRRFHEKQFKFSWLEFEGAGLWGRTARPLRRVGIYVPGGTAAYPSSVLMNAIPAQVAGVEEIVMISPPDSSGSLSPHTLVAAGETGIGELYRIGGAHGIAALAYGTGSIKPVLKITGPGNVYVTAAKKCVFGDVDIDMLAGPSEVFIIADGLADPRLVAADMLAQAEHDVNAIAVLATPDKRLAKKVEQEVERQLALLSRREIASASLENNGLIVLTRDLDEALLAANSFAPEHLEIIMENPLALAGRVESAGAIFLGCYTPEPVGDYFGGPNHVLPTGGTARFASPLGVETFMKSTSILYYGQKDLVDCASEIQTLARVEGLDAHANAVEVRGNGGRED